MFESPNGGPRPASSARGRPWLWGYAMIAGLFVLSWLDAPAGSGRSNPTGQFASIGMFTIPAVLIVGGLLAFVPQRMRRFRAWILAPIAFYVAAIGAPFTFRAPASACDGLVACDSSATARMVGFLDQSVVWASGFVVEGVAIRIRRPRL